MRSITIQKTGITKLKTDAIVNAANSALMAGGGVCGAIFAEAGKRELQDACNAIGGCETGSAVITPGFRLNAQYIIHAVGPQWRGGSCGEEAQLAGCYRAALGLAMEHHCRSIAFPLISSGIYGYPKKEAWETALRTVDAFLRENKTYPLEVAFAVLDDEMLRMGNEILASLEAASRVVRFHKPEETNGYLSNWYPSEFTVQGKTYCCSEQYMMEQKALLFGDAAMAGKIMQTRDPQEMQDLGQAVLNFDQRTWDGTKQIIVYQALTEKFRQNPELRQKLMETGDAILAECSRSDRVWGVGLGMDDPRADHPKAWKGQNLLGYTLQAVRQSLLRETGEVPPRMFCWGDKGSKVFWFAETGDGGQKLVRPDGTFAVCEEKNPSFDLSRQSQAGWQRARLLMAEYEIWDATAFGCTMGTLLGVFPQQGDRETAYLFSTCQNAEKAVYPYLTKKAAEECRQNVDRFYENPGLQAAWSSFVLHPVCLRITKGSRNFVPIFIGDLGDGESVLGAYRFEPVASLENPHSIAELFEI